MYVYIHVCFCLCMHIHYRPDVDICVFLNCSLLYLFKKFNFMYMCVSEWWFGLMSVLPGEARRWYLTPGIGSTVSFEPSHIGAWIQTWMLHK